MSSLLFCRKLNDSGDAGYKFPADVQEIFRQMGRDVLFYGHKPNASVVHWSVDTAKLVLGGVKKVKKNSCVYVLFPIGERSIRFIKRRCKKTNSKMIGMIIDINSLRYEDEDPQKETKLLLMFDALIVQNGRQQEYVRKLGFRGEVSKLGVLDYLCVPSEKDASLSDRKICYGGSLYQGQSGFLKEWSESGFIKTFHVNVYGPHMEFPIEGNTFSYEGEYSADTIIEHISGSFGLVWNGESIHTLSGAMGDYYRYATPHKMSMYLMAGMPVIVHKDSAAAKFVKENGIGILISSLTELEKIFSDVSDDQYAGMKNCVYKIREKLAEGYYLRRSLAEIESMIIAE